VDCFFLICTCPTVQPNLHSTARSIFGGDCASHTDLNRESGSGSGELRKLRLGSAQPLRLMQWPNEPIFDNGTSKCN